MPSKATKTRKPIKKQQATSPSLTSLLTSITKISTTSSGSGSTVTPESYTRQQPHSRRSSSKTVLSPTKKLMPTTPPIQPTPLENENGRRPNVFSFMEHDDDDDDSDALSQEQSDDEDKNEDEEGEEVSESEDEEDEDEDEDDGEAGYEKDAPGPRSIGTPRLRGRPASDSFHSDSGISIRSSSPDHDSPTHPRKQPEPVVRRQTRPRQLNLDSSPESFYKRPARSVPQTATFAAPPPFQITQSLVPAQRQQAPPVKVQSTDIWSKLTVQTDAPDSVHPIYRRFEHLTNKLLMTLQHELQHLEKQLSSLDSTLTSTDPANPRARSKQPTLPMLPQQRSYLLAQRAELFGLVSAKLEQYHRALTSYHSLAKTDTPGAEQVERLKALAKSSPFDPTFLARLEDLSIVSTSSFNAQRRESQSTAGLGSSKEDQASALFTGGAVLMTLLAFKFVPRFIARVVLGGIIAAAMIGCGMLPDLARERWGRQVGVYAGAVILLAMVVA